MNSATAAVSRPPATIPEHSGYVPILRISRQRIGELSKRQSTSLMHLQQAIEADPCVALNLFAEVNRMLKRGGRQPVTDIPRAVLFMGSTDFIARIRTSTILEELSDEKQVGALLRILCRAHHASCQARAIGSLVGGQGKIILEQLLTK